MLAFFPSLYPDELFYSVLARYYSRSGYMAYIYAAEELYEKNTTRPDMEFINHLKKDLLSILPPIKDIILNHTMFPYYARFLSKERRTEAYNSLAKMNGNIHNLLAIPKTREIRYLRYCPMCADADRKEFGETYWHRIHQMTGVNVCPIHGCYLINSDISISSKTSPMLVTAEEKAICSDFKKSQNKIELDVAKFLMTVFHSKLNMNSNINVGTFLHSQMAGTKYRSVRGQQRNMELLHMDFLDKFKSLNPDIKESWQLQKVLNGYRTNTYEICLIAMLLNISPKSLTNMKLPKKSQEEIFDKKVKELHNQGLKYPEIAKSLNASYNIVKPIGENLYGSYSYKSNKPKMRRIDGKNWMQIDQDTLPLVVNAISVLKGNNTTKPKRITIATIEKFLGLPCKRIYLLPLCKAEVEKHYETQEQYWARKIVWAMNYIELHSMPLHLTNIQKLTNIYRKDFYRAVPYITNADVKSKITALLYH